jgi:DNA-binding NarL/FixJ family response regulator
MPSARTRYVLELLRSGYTQEQVAATLGISEERVATIVWAATRTLEPTQEPRRSMTPAARTELLSRLTGRFRRP